ncbi:restriction endonuclease subunit S [Pseudomonas solani]|uniref:restriction endonuclease subunit S n=1 Tax=Pseudomonas solani TaxID=2731552 RepID=UPI0035BE9B34
MSSEWRSYRLDEAGRIVTGKTPKGNVAKYVGRDVPFVTPPDFDGSKWIDETARRISKSGALSVKNSIVPAGSVLVTCIGSDMGKAALTRSSCVTNQQINAVVVDEDRFCPEFLYYNLSLRKDEIRGLAGGSAQPILNKSAFGQVRFNCPPLLQQKAIAAAVGPLDNRITLLRETNATLEAIAQALFKSWFVDFDPVRAKAEGRQPESMDATTAALFPDSFEESELGLVPEGWMSRPIYDMATYINGAAYKAFEPNAERRGLPIIKIAELKAGVSAQTAFSDVAMPTKYLIETGDILFSWSGNPDTSIDTFVWQHAPALLNQHIFRVLPHETCERSFVLQMLRNLKPVFAELARNKQTTGLGHVTVADMKRLQVVYPPMSVIEQFNILAVPIHQMIFGNEQQAQTLTQLRDTLLPRLISGQLRLPEAEKIIEGVLA